MKNTNIRLSIDLHNFDQKQHIQVSFWVFNFNLISTNQRKHHPPTHNFPVSCINDCKEQIDGNYLQKMKMWCKSQKFWKKHLIWMSLIIVFINTSGSKALFNDQWDTYFGLMFQFCYNILIISSLILYMKLLKSYL